VDGMSQAVPAGPFGWRQHPCARLRRWVSTDAFDYADAEHDAYGRLPDPVRHRRRVVFVKPRYWLVVDDIEGAESHHVELRFQLGALEARLEPGSWARATAAGHALLLRPFCEATLHARVARGGEEPIEGWVAPDYGGLQPAPVIVYSVTARLPLRVLTLLLPSADPEATPPAVRPLRDEGRGLVGLVFEETEETVLLDGAEDHPVRLDAAPRSS
jgi:heparinase II/III-like protein